MTGFIYFIGCHTFVKIGCGSSPFGRMEVLQAGCPYPLEMLAAYPGTIADESELHQRLAKFRGGREWFARSPEIDELIRVARDLYPENLKPYDPPESSCRISGDKLASWLKQHGIRKYAFAKKIGVRASVVTDYCKGRYVPSKRTAEAILLATAGQITPNDFLSIATPECEAAE